MDKKDKDELISYISSLKKNSFTDHLIEYISSNGSIRPGVSVKSRSGRKGIVEIPLTDSFQVDSEEDLELIRKII